MKLLRTQDAELQQLQDNVYEVVRTWEVVPLLQGLLIEDVILGATATDVAHGLGRRPRGWIVTRRNGTATIYEPSAAALPDRFLKLQATATIVCSLWVF